MAKKIKNYVKDKQPKTLWNKIGPFVKLREYLASNITPDVYANERGLKNQNNGIFWSRCSESQCR